MATKTRRLTLNESQLRSLVREMMNNNKFYGDGTVQDTKMLLSISLQFAHGKDENTELVKDDPDFKKFVNRFAQLAQTFIEDDEELRNVMIKVGREGDMTEVPTQKLMDPDRHFLDVTASFQPGNSFKTDSPMMQSPAVQATANRYANKLKPYAEGIWRAMRDATGNKNISIELIVVVTDAIKTHEYHDFASAKIDIGLHG